jgi:class 3 adenylate cyclase
MSVSEAVRAFGLQVRAGLHTGEMEHGPAGEVHGIAVHTDARVAALAGPGEVLVFRTIRDLVAGAPIQLDSRGSHELRGVPGPWEIFAVRSQPTAAEDADRASIQALPHPNAAWATIAGQQAAVQTTVKRTARNI